MFVGTVLYRAESGQYPWRRALLVVSFVFGVLILAAFWHISPQDHNIVTTRIGLNALAAAGLTFAVAMLCRNKKVPRALAWLGVVSYSVYLIHPVLIEVYNSVPWTHGQNFVPMELLLVAVFLLVLLVCSALTHRFIELPMQRKGRQLTRWLDARFGEDVLPRPRLEPARELADPAPVAAASGAGPRR
jgi:peptidoglycan/LPS O-acetylase OafA/YrhL